MAEAQHAPYLLASTPALECRRRLLPDGWVIESRPAVDGPAEADVVVRDPWGRAAKLRSEDAPAPGLAIGKWPYCTRYVTLEGEGLP